MCWKLSLGPKAGPSGDKVEQGGRSEQREALPGTQELPARQQPGARDGGEVQHVERLSREKEEGYKGTITSLLEEEDGMGTAAPHTAVGGQLVKPFKRQV